ncbi:MAG TPA: MFS transporter [Parapedobacter sp.]|uniref:CynX/NimT family MFS transporter n=1 Tax=Parapedobacter sp. TaxID=1958893 RepID=UPI002B8AFE31|nr:MFS transporter [Parapedobacter sp.]HWK56770.1 MFS transporter [Parapedobacter sp.]
MTNESRGTTRWGTYMLLTGIILVASNLRAPITSVGPVIPQIQASLHLSNTLAGLITTVPLLAFALLSPVAPKLAERWTIETLLWAAIWAIGLGLLIRISSSVALLFAGTALVGCGIAFGNVLVPPFIKQRFPQKVGLATGIYSAAMNITASLASGFSIAIGRWTGQGWKGSIGVWLIFSLIAIAFWAPQLKRRSSGASADRSVAHPDTGASMLRSRLAWYITIFMGLQSFLFYCSIAWLPVVLQDWGMASETSGWVLSFVQFTQLPIMFVGPIVADRLRNHTPLVWFIGVTLALSLLLIIGWQTQFIIPAVILFGLGTGLAFSLVMMWFVLRTKTTREAARISGMAQSFGYALAAMGPPLFGALYDWVGNWETPFLLLVVATVVLFITGIKVAKPGFAKG